MDHIPLSIATYAQGRQFDVKTWVLVWKVGVSWAQVWKLWWVL